MPIAFQQRENLRPSGTPKPRDVVANAVAEIMNSCPISQTSGTTGHPPVTPHRLFEGQKLYKVVFRTDFRFTVIL
jgi:hypothetical protein